MIAIGDGYIGNSRQQNDNLIAVPNARRLGDLCLALTDRFKPASRAEIEAGRKGLFGVYDLEWLAQVRAEAKAIHILQGAIGTGELRLWRVHDGRDVQIVPLRLLHNDIRYGIFKTFDRPEPDMQGAWLWVKEEDWEVFLARLQQPADGHAIERAPQSGRPRKMEAVIEGLQQIYPDPDVLKHAAAKVAVRALGNLGIVASETTVKRAKRQLL